MARTQLSSMLSRLDRVGARHRRVIEPIHRGLAGSLGVNLDGRTLAPLAVLIGTEIRRSRAM
jgi:hypothetical protein